MVCFSEVAGCIYGGWAENIRLQLHSDAEPAVPLTGATLQVQPIGCASGWHPTVSRSQQVTTASNESGMSVPMFTSAALSVVTKEAECTEAEYGTPTRGLSSKVPDWPVPRRCHVTPWTPETGREAAFGPSPALDNIV